jgi:hypothetical protein
VGGQEASAVAWPHELLEIFESAITCEYASLTRAGSPVTENHTLIGTLASGEDGVRLRVERALADWSLTGNRLQKSVGFLRKGRRLTPRLKAEAARRGQPVPTVRLP